MRVVIISFLTNMLVDALPEEATDGDVQQAMSELLVNDGIYGFCLTFPDVRVFLAAPNIRLKPIWYSRLRPTIIRCLHQFLESAPQNLQLLEDFGGDLEPDQVHFMLMSGICYVKHLVDRTVELLALPVPDKQKRYWLFVRLLAV